MNRQKYSIGIDYGTQSGRLVLANINNGEIIASTVIPYKNGVITDLIPETDIPLESDWALQDPNDYINVIEAGIPKILSKSKVNKKNIIGIGIDFTACTMMPITENGKVLCQLEEFYNRPHAWVKLWKHHAAQSEASKLNKIAFENKEKFLKRYGGKISSEWLIPKIWQILNEDEEIYNKAYRFVEASDWIIMQLTGNLLRNNCCAGYKAIWHEKQGFPSKEFLKKLDNRLESLVDEKLGNEIEKIGTLAGRLTKEMSEKTGLSSETAVAVGNVDAHVSVPAVKVSTPGKMVMIMGTSICHMVLGEKEKEVEGICGVVKDGIIPGYYGYEAGQSAVGDIFEWFVKNCVPASYSEEAAKNNLTIHELLESKARLLRPGESGLLALDWWNGNRSTLVDADLSGLIVGMNLLTKPEEIYRALIEATAFGTKIIIETFVSNGIDINELYVCGGLPQKNKLLMQIYSDVTNMDIKISASSETPALGSAMYGAVAAGSNNGGYDSILEASKKMAKLKDFIYHPIKENVVLYEKLYLEYKKLYDFFGRNMEGTMKKLKSIKMEGEA